MLYLVKYFMIIFCGMKIPAEKEFAIKKAILKAIEHGYTLAQLADGFGVSKSLIYKYRRALRDQGFIRKNKNDIYVITQNKFSLIILFGLSSIV